MNEKEVIKTMTNAKNVLKDSRDVGSQKLVVDKDLIEKIRLKKESKNIKL